MDDAEGWTQNRIILEKLIKLMKPRKLPREATDPKERAQLFWWWAMDKIKLQIKEFKKRNMKGVTKLGS